jgi:hypothetical protein
MFCLLFDNTLLLPFPHISVTKTQSIITNIPPKSFTSIKIAIHVSTFSNRHQSEQSKRRLKEKVSLTKNCFIGSCDEKIEAWHRNDRFFTPPLGFIFKL